MGLHGGEHAEGPEGCLRGVAARVRQHCARRMQQGAPAPLGGPVSLVHLRDGVRMARASFKRPLLDVGAGELGAIVAVPEVNGAGSGSADEKMTVVTKAKARAALDRLGCLRPRRK